MPKQDSFTIPAEVHTDDLETEAEFDAEPWFTQASDEEIIALAGINWGGDYAADDVAAFFEETNDEVGAVFDHARGSDEGFECHVNGQAAIKWIEQNRPTVLTALDDRKKMIEQLYSNEGRWRNDLHPEKDGDTATINTFITHATDDAVGDGEYYSFGVAHVRGWHGKGFIPFTVFKALRDQLGYGNVSYGTDDAAYEKAVAEGQKMIDRSNQKMREEMKKLEDGNG